MTMPLITAERLQALFDAAQPVVTLDCRARLGDAAAGERLWRDGHLPGSQHVDLDRDLSGPPGKGGRHPLPASETFTTLMRRLGISPDVPVVVYDDMGGQMAAARAWWMLACWVGHPRVWVLDGGLAAWQAVGGALATDASSMPTSPMSSDWSPRFDASCLVGADEVLSGILSGRAMKLDARTAERFRGEVEPIDPVAGHIPGARCRPSAENLTMDGRFKSPEALSSELPSAEEVIAYCGSGISACHTVLAYAVAGRPLPRLYVGSWSEWITDASRPVERGP